MYVITRRLNPDSEATVKLKTFLEHTRTSFKNALVLSAIWSPVNVKAAISL